MATGETRIAAVLKKYEDDLLAEWLREMPSMLAGKEQRFGDLDLQDQAREFLSLLQRATQQGELSKMDRPEWSGVVAFLNDFSRRRVLQGFTSDETATFIFSFKKPLFARLKTEFGGDADGLVEAVWEATELLDRLGLMTVRAFQKTREEVIQRQQQELLELSTPVVKLWEGVLALPMIGTLDSARTQLVMESLLNEIVETESDIAIIDITGVPTVDTLVAQHLLKTVAAIRLMGADCIISGVRPQIAQTIVHLGVDLQGVTTKASLADALTLALKRSGYVVTKSMKAAL